MTDAARRTGRTLRLGSLVLFAILVAAPTMVRAEKKLRWQFSPDQQLKQVMVQNVNIAMKLGERDFSTTMTQTIDTQWKIRSVNEEGVADMSQTITRVQMTLKGPGIAYDVDTDAKEIPDGLGKPIAETLKSLVNNSFQLKMNTLGEVIDVTVPEEMANAIQAAPGGEQLAGTFSEEGIENMIIQGTPSFPEKAVDEGAKWSREFSMKIPPVGTMNIVSTYTYAGVQEGDPPLDKLTVGLKQSIDAEGAGGMQINMKDQQTEGTILFDNQAGRMVRSETKQKVTMEISTGGQTIDQVVDQSIEVTFTPVE